ncbi:adenylyltransferase/cytidyltransferase family protein, partial [Burkholderia humptydooensis]
MKVFRGLPNAESRAPCALTIGNFDGVHRGHQALLARVRAAADARGLPVCVMTFEPHPREFFNPASAPPRIAMLRDKLEALREHGVDRVVVEHFNHTFASQSPEAFVERTLVHGLHTRWIMVGDDFCYGAKRAGNFASLKAAGERFGFEVEQMETLADADGARISSSGVRAALAA